MQIGGTAKGWLIASRPQFLMAYAIFFAGGIVFGMTQGFEASAGSTALALITMITAALAVHYRDESADWDAGYDTEHGGAGVIRNGLVTSKALSSAGNAFAACALILIAVVCYAEPRALVAGMPGAVMILFHNHLTETVVLGHELVTAMSYWSAVAWAYLVQGWQATPSFALFTLFCYLVALAFVPYQDIGDYNCDKASGKKTLTVRLGPDKVGMLSIVIGLTAILFLYGSLLLLP